MKHWHEVLPKRYGAIERFNHQYPVVTTGPDINHRTLEIGAGLGEHLAYEDLARQEYHCLEIRASMAAEISRRFPSAHTAVGDCQHEIPYQDGYFDRVVAVHVLEHLRDLPAALDEVHRVLRPEGRFSIVIPCDPGLAYGIARRISAERIFRKRYRQRYDWFINREHVNSPAEIIAEVRRRMPIVHRQFWPLRVPVVSANLCLGMTAVKDGN
jgi:SAM-dependent methyltransferase